MSAMMDVVMQGYLLKKKRKKMQGMARRWCSLSKTGALSYSFNPTSPVRDSVFVSLSYVSANRKQRSFHIDSGRTVMHFKALSEGDFDRWAEALRGFIGNVQDQQHRKGVRVTAAMLGSDEVQPTIELGKVFGAVARMTTPIQDLESLLTDLKTNEAAHSTSPVSHSPKFKFLKKSGRGQSTEDYFEAKSTTESLIKQLSQAIATIKSQHIILAECVSTLPQLARDDSMVPLHGIRTYASRSSAYQPTAPHPGSSRSSFSMNSGDTEDFYEDAMIGEFVLEEEEASASGEDESGNESDSGAGDATFASTEEEGVVHSRQTTEEEAEDDRRSGSGQTEVPHSPVTVRRRPQLPAPITGDEFSMLGMLRKNVGKDLSTISFPVTINEPLSALQRIAEELEYSDLLHRAAATQDSIERLTLVATFAISGSSGNKYRTSRKPFNPLLGETFECIRPDKGFKFISEKVSHHPPIMAFHAEAAAWKIGGHVAPSQKFWGRSMEVFVTGDFNITFSDTGDTFTVRKPSSFVRNLVAGTKYLEVVGDMLITNTTTSEKAIISFKEGSTWGGLSSRNKIEGRVCDSAGRTKVELVGRWDERIERKEGKDVYERLWQINEFPQNAERYYGFSKFSVELNETTEMEQGFAATDSRLRPDQLALERGDIDEAEETKKRVEEKQRAKRTAGTTPPPQHFIADGDGWKYSGQYFEKREKKTLVDLDIF